MRESSVYQGFRAGSASGPGYEINDILAYAVSAGMETVIPPKKNRREQRRSIADGRKRDDPLEISNMDFYQS